MLDTLFGPRDFLMVPRILFELKPGDLEVYLRLLYQTRASGHAVPIVDKATGEVLAEVPLAAGEVFVSRRQIGLWHCGGMRGLGHEDIGRNCVKRLIAAGLVRIAPASARKARRGWSRDILALPLAAVHKVGRPGPLAAPGADPSATAEKVCSPSAGSDVAITPEDRAA